MSARILFGEMNTFRSLEPKSSGLLTRTLLFLLLLNPAACTARATPTLFIPPTDREAQPAAALPTSVGTSIPTATRIPTATALAPTPTPCANDLSFVQDITVPDGTAVAPGEPVDKQWLVTNVGTCNWDASYRLKLITGDAMGAADGTGAVPGARRHTGDVAHRLHRAANSRQLRERVAGVRAGWNGVRAGSLPADQRDAVRISETPSQKALEDTGDADRIEFCGRSEAEDAKSGQIVHSTTSRAAGHLGGSKRHAQRQGLPPRTASTR